MNLPTEPKARGDDRTQISSPSAICALIGCRNRDTHAHTVLIESDGAPIDCKDHKPAECPTCIAAWARVAGNRRDKRD